MMQVWSGKTKYFDEIIDTFASAGIKYEIQGNSILVDEKDYSNAYGMLCELNSILNAGW